MSNSIETVQLTRGEEIFGGVVFIILATIAVQLVLINCVKTYRDFKTANRFSVKHQRQSPNNAETTYKLMAFLKTIAIFCFGLAIVLSAILRNFWPLDTECLAMINVLVIAWKIALAAQYLTYILYLYQCYPEPPIGYKQSTLKIIAVLIIIFALAMTIVLVLKGGSLGRNVPDVDREFPYYCSWSIHDTEGTPTVEVIVFGVTILFWDLFLSIGSLIAFRRSWNKLMEKAQATVSSTDVIFTDKTYKKSLYSGRKYKVIVTATSITTLIWILLGIVGEENTSSIFAGVDWIVSIIGLMLMHPYYPNDKWYESLCCLCILCDPVCDPHKYESNASGPHKGDENSVDTINAVHAYYTKYMMKGNEQEMAQNNNNNNVDLNAGDQDTTAAQVR